MHATGEEYACNWKGGKHASGEVYACKCGEVCMASSMGGMQSSLCRRFERGVWHAATARRAAWGGYSVRTGPISTLSTSWESSRIAPEISPLASRQSKCCSKGGAVAWMAV
jgi:hypothetical protein